MMAGEIAARMGLNDRQRNLLCFLIEHHLILAETALKRDLMDEKPIAQCAVTIKDRQRLLLLYMLTVADSLATGTEAWNTWKASLLRELFFKVDRLLLRADLEPEDIEARTAQIQEKVLALLPDPAESRKAVRMDGEAAFQVSAVSASAGYSKALRHGKATGAPFGLLQGGTA